MTETESEILLHSNPEDNEDIESSSSSSDIEFIDE